jgi:hypothetical protein
VLEGSLIEEVFRGRIGQPYLTSLPKSLEVGAEQGIAISQDHRAAVGNILVGIPEDESNGSLGIEAVAMDCQHDRR